MFLSYSIKYIECPHCGYEHNHSQLHSLRSHERSKDFEHSILCTCNHMLQLNVQLQISSSAPAVGSTEVKVLHWFPRFWPYYMGVFGVIIAPAGKQPGERVINHERIHFAQQRELWYLPFFLLYVCEFLVRLVLKRFNWDKAYRSISFEREAYAQERNYTYLQRRKRHAWRKYL